MALLPNAGSLHFLGPLEQFSHPCKSNLLKPDWLSHSSEKVKHPLHIYLERNKNQKPANFRRLPLQQRGNCWVIFLDWQNFCVRTQLCKCKGWIFHPVKPSASFQLISVGRIHTVACQGSSKRQSLPLTTKTRLIGHHTWPTISQIIRNPIRFAPLLCEFERRAHGERSQGPRRPSTHNGCRKSWEDRVASSRASLGQKG